MGGFLRPIIIGISGASGAAIARAAVEMLLDRRWPVILTCTAAGAAVWQQEIERPLADVVAEWQRRGLIYYHVHDLRAPIASGTYATAGEAVLPPTTST